MMSVRTTLLSILAGAYLLNHVEISVGQEPDPGLKSISFSGEGPMFSRRYIGTHNGGEIYTSGIDSGKPIYDEHGNLVVYGGLGQKIIRVMATNQTQGDIRRLSAAYPLKSGEIIPVAGFLYRVRQNRNLYALLEWIPAKDLPRGLAATKRDSLVIPLFRYGIGKASLDSQRITVSEIVTPEDSKKGKTKAKLLFERNGGPWHAEIAPGDLVLLTKEAFEVRAIVPADAKMKTAGWVEFAPSFIPEADLIRDKKPFVRPMPKQEGKK